MKKNGQYVGVDEKYIPEEEKYVDNEANEEIKGKINEELSSFTNYITDNDTKENIKKAGKKGLKIAKRIGIGYIIFLVIIVIMAISTFVFVFINIIKINKRVDKGLNVSNSFIDEAPVQMDENNNNQILNVYR